MPASTKKSPEEVLLRKEAARWARIKKVYGLDKEQYDEIDNGHCPVCVRDWSDTVRPVVDHDHVTGFVRGLLCIFCNRYRVGRLRDADLVQRIAEYLRGPFKYIAPPKPKKKRKRKSK